MVDLRPEELLLCFTSTAVLVVEFLIFVSLSIPYFYVVIHTHTHYMLALMRSSHPAIASPDCWFKRHQHWRAGRARVRRRGFSRPPLPVGSIFGGAKARPQGFANEGQAFAGAGVWGDLGGGAGA